jgi:hypothetical protein
MLLAALVASFMRRHWLSGLGVRPHPFHAGIPMLAAGASVLLGVWLGGLAADTALAGAHPMVIKALAPLIALVFYGAFVALWRKAQPGVLSLNRYRVR